MSNLTLSKLKQSIQSLNTLHYGTSDTCPKGECYLSLGTRWSPPYVIVHPDDLEALQGIITLPPLQRDFP